MLTQSDLSKAISEYKIVSSKAIKAAEGVRLPEPTKITFSTFRLDQVNIEELAAEVPTGYGAKLGGAHYIYVFRLSEANVIPHATILSAFSVARTYQAENSDQEKKNLCRSNPNAAESTVVYVGRASRPRQRFKSHLQASKSGTFAMHLAAWASDLDIEMDFHLYPFYGADHRAIQVLEDGLWDLLAPMLGRRGER